MHEEKTLEAVRWRSVRELGKACEAAEANLRRARELHERAEEAIREKNRREVGEWAWGVLEDENAVILALGTTGLCDPVDVVEIEVFAVAGGGETVFRERVCPASHEVEIEAGATGLHGHTIASLEDARTFGEVWPELIPILSSTRIVAYNAEYVERVLKQTIARYNLEPLGTEIECAMEQFSRIEGQWSVEKEHYYNVALPGRGGTPGGNARATYALLRRMASAYLIPEPVETSTEEDFSDIPF